MLMTSSFRADVRSAVCVPLSLAIVVVLLVYPELSLAAQTAPDAPRPALTVMEEKTSITKRPAMAASVELKSVSVRRPDETQKKMAGAAFLKRASEPLVIEVVTQEALPSKPKTSSPVIVLNGEKLVDTWVVLPDKLVAFLPNRSKLKDVNRVEVMWLGNEKATLTKQPLTLLAQTDEKGDQRQMSFKDVLTTLIKNRDLFGRDFPTAFASLPAWARIGEQKITIFPGQIVGSTPYRKPEDVQQLVLRLSGELKAYSLQPNAEFIELLKGISAQQLQVKTVSGFPDDDSVRIVMTNSPSGFLNPKMTVAAVVERLGKPEKIVRQLIQTEKERRPIVLTLYTYAGNAIAFAESDISPIPGSVDRVILDVPSITAELFQGAK